MTREFIYPWGIFIKKNILKAYYTPYLIIGLIMALLMPVSNKSLFAQSAANSTTIVEKHIIGYNDVTKMKFVFDSALYSEGWQIQQL